MLIRVEAPSDMLAIDALNKAVFPTHAEADLVASLREKGLITLSLVACDDDGQVCGHALFSSVTIEGEDVGVQGLAPVCVTQAHQNQGVANQLIREGLEMLHELGYAGCVVLGDPKYYGRFGFQTSTLFGLQCQWEVPEEVFMALELEHGIFEHHKGLVRFSEPFSVF